MQPGNDFVGAMQTFAARAKELGLPDTSRFYWYHTIDLGDGLVTPGMYDYRHTVGEFGVVLMIGGNLAGITRVASVQIYDHVEALEYTQAHRLAAVMLIFSFLVLLAVYAWRPNPKKGT